MKHSLFFFSILYYILTSFNLQAQSFAPVGTTWSYTYHDDCPLFGCEEGQSTIQVIADTIINNITAKKIVQNDSYIIYDPMGDPLHRSTLLGYLFERNDSIYFSPNKTLKDSSYIFGFNMHVNDNFLIRDHIKITVDSIKIEDVNGEQKNAFYITKTYPSGSMGEPFSVHKIIEGIGPIDDYLFWNNSDGEYGTTYSFSCYSDGNTNYPTGCKTLSIKNIVEYSFSISPNPCTSELTITSEEIIEHIEIYNSYGIKMQNIFPENMTETKIQLTLPSGPYIMMIYNHNRFGAKHFIVK